MSGKKPLFEGRQSGNFGDAFKTASAQPHAARLDILVDISGTLFPDCIKPDPALLKFIIAAHDKGHMVTFSDPIATPFMTEKVEEHVLTAARRPEFNADHVRRLVAAGFFAVKSREDLLRTAATQRRVFDLVIDDDPGRYSGYDAAFCADPHQPGTKALISSFGLDPSQDLVVLVDQYVEPITTDMQVLDHEPNAGSHADDQGGENPNAALN